MYGVKGVVHGNKLPLYYNPPKNSAELLFFCLQDSWINV